jgi:iron complex transport system substrate-binding protein
LRIVSLLGSATEIVHALGLGDHLVGISHECDHPPAALHLPRVSRPRFDPTGLTSGEVDAAVRRCMEEYGAVYEVDRAALRELRPSLVLTQDVCEVCAVPTGSVQEAVAELPDAPEVLSLDAHTLEEIFHTVQQIAAAADAPALGETLVANLRERVETVESRTRGRRRPRVLALEWLDPPFAPGHWVPEMVERAGGENLLGKAGRASMQITWEDAAGRDPELLLMAPCGYGLDEARADADRNRAVLEGLGGEVLAGRRWLLHSAWFSRSGPRVVQGIEVLARLLHPSLFPEVALRGRAERWN